MRLDNPYKKVVLVAQIKFKKAPPVRFKIRYCETKPFHCFIQGHRNQGALSARSQFVSTLFFDQGTGRKSSPAMSPGVTCQGALPYSHCSGRDEEEQKETGFRERILLKSVAMAGA